MGFEYFYEDQADQFSFYRIPKVLFTDIRFQAISTEAKVLYGLLLDRVSLSRQNGWIDEEGRVYIIFTLKAVMAAMGCGKGSATKYLRELESLDLIERIKQGLCKPAIIYVKNFSQEQNLSFQRTNNWSSGGTECGIQEDQKLVSNNTEINNTEFNNTNHILSADEERMRYEDYLNEQLSISILKQSNPYETETIDGIVDLMVDVLCSKKQTIRISGEEKPISVVKSRFMKLNYSHIEYVMKCLHDNTTKVKNIKQYLLATLYNAPSTISSYYQAEVNHDMATGWNQEEGYV